LKVNLKLGRVGMNMQEATVSRWYVNPGDSFEEGDVLYEIETEKVTQEVEAPAAGTLLEILVPAESEAEVGQAVCVVEMNPGRS
jgi:pyruvate/2-oxoglutarate dehydrogenase complex dihydrolipoamide acyltransferase (E2) component